MKLSFRWYGEDDKVTLENIRQIPGMQSIVTAVYDVPVGEVWSRESIAALKKQVEDAGLGFDVIESIPVHEDIKLGKDTRDKYIDNYCENIRRVAEAGIKCICYNFMPVLTGRDPAWISRCRTAPMPLFTIKRMWTGWIRQRCPCPAGMLPYFPEEIEELIREYQLQGIEGLWEI